MIRKLKWKFIAVTMALVSLVLLIVFLLLQRKFIEGMAGGAVKG